METELIVAPCLILPISQFWERCSLVQQCESHLRTWSCRWTFKFRLCGVGNQLLNNKGYFYPNKSKRKVRVGRDYKPSLSPEGGHSRLLDAGQFGGLWLMSLVVEVLPAAEWLHVMVMRSVPISLQGFGENKTFCSQWFQPKSLGENGNCLEIIARYLRKLEEFRIQSCFQQKIKPQEQLTALGSNLRSTSITLLSMIAPFLPWIYCSKTDLFPS